MELVLMGKLREVEPIVPTAVYAKMVALRQAVVTYCDRLDAIQNDVWVEMGPGEDLDAKAHRKLFVQLVRKREGHYLPYHMNRYDDLCANAWNFWQQNKKEGQWTDTTLDFLLEVCS